MNWKKEKKAMWEVKITKADYVLKVSCRNQKMKIILKSLKVNKTDTCNSGYLWGSKIGGVERFFYFLICVWVYIMVGLWENLSFCIFLVF